jgi:NAD(P)-dependent dehydrogenase (short-subunit alcohol dehydrogenase family)
MWLLNVIRRRTKSSYKPVILITGCGSGLGYATAELLAKVQNYRVVITARRRAIEFLKAKFPESDRIMVRELDVNEETQRQVLCSEISKTWGGVDILVNNAGISYRAVVEHMTEAEELHQLRTNYLGPMGLIREIVPQLRRKGRGKIINVSSVSGMVAMPTLSAYSASKYALEGASEALWYEMKPLGINVCLVQPGFVHSNSFFNVYYTRKAMDAEAGDEPYSDYYQHMTPFIEKMMRRSSATPEKIARLIVKVIQTENPPLWIPASLDAIVFYYVRRLLPRRLLMPFLFYCLPGSRHWAKSYSRRRS